MPPSSGRMKNSLYSMHPSFAMEEASLQKLRERTGKTLEEWIEVLKASGPPTEKERREWLKREHGFTTNYSWWVAERAEGRGSPADYDPDAYVEAMFAGSKTGLRPLYDELLRLGLALGDDVKACPCQTIVPLYRGHVFAQLKPATRTRLDLGLALRDTPFTARLQDTGGLAKKDRITHRIAIESLDDIDAEAKRWLRAAYDLAGEGQSEKGKKKPAPELAVPDDLAAALAADARAKAAWERLAPSHRREHIKAILEAKKPETRARRVAGTLAQLAKEKPKAKKS
jgi:hypothetical protein